METALNKTLQFCDSSGLHTPSNHQFAMLAKCLLVTQNTVQRSGQHPSHLESASPLVSAYSTPQVLSPSSLEEKTNPVLWKNQIFFPTFGSWDCGCDICAPSKAKLLFHSKLNKHVCKFIQAWSLEKEVPKVTGSILTSQIILSTVLLLYLFFLKCSATQGWILYWDGQLFHRFPKVYILMLFPGSFGSISHSEGADWAQWDLMHSIKVFVLWKVACDLTNAACWFKLILNAVWLWKIKNKQQSTDPAQTQSGSWVKSRNSFLQLALPSPAPTAQSLFMGEGRFHKLPLHFCQAKKS